MHVLVKWWCCACDVTYCAMYVVWKKCNKYFSVCSCCDEMISINIYKKNKTDVCTDCIFSNMTFNDTSTMDLDAGDQRVSIDCLVQDLYLQCVSSGDTTVLCSAINIPSQNNKWHFVSRWPHIMEVYLLFPSQHSHSLYDDGIPWKPFWITGPLCRESRAQTALLHIIAKFWCFFTWSSPWMISPRNINCKFSLHIPYKDS